MIQIAVYGAGGFAREVAWLAESCTIDAQAVQIVCFIDDNPARHGSIMNDIPIMGLQEARDTFPQAKAVVGIGSPQIREKVVEQAEVAGFAFASLVHDKTEMSRWVEIGEGSVICAGNIITANIRLGKHVNINLDCTIGHNVMLKDYATLAPGVHVSGYVELGKRVYIGTGAVIINGTADKPLVIGDGTVVGAGACVTKSLPSNIVVAGVPAREIRSLK